MRAGGQRWRDEGGTVLVVSLMAMVVLSLLGAALLTMSGSETYVSYRTVYREGAFYAAEGGIHIGLDQISGNTATSTQAIPLTTIGGNYTYRSGRRSDPGPQPLQFVGTRPGTGYSIAIGTGYNPAGYIFYNYQMNVTGTGPRNAQREVEARVAFGPVPQ
ncbi:MAG: PilX N-terminal domain-containing pilus assembly protein [Candidatus Methylomirabilales bacterium]